MKPQQVSRERRDSVVTKLATLIQDAAAAHSVNDPLPYGEAWFRAEAVVKELEDLLCQPRGES